MNHFFKTPHCSHGKPWNRCAIHVDNPGRDFIPQIRPHTNKKVNKVLSMPLLNCWTYALLLAQVVSLSAVGKNAWQIFTVHILFLAGLILSRLCSFKYKKQYESCEYCKRTPLGVLSVKYDDSEEHNLCHECLQQFKIYLEKEVPNN